MSYQCFNFFEKNENKNKALKYHKKFMMILQKKKN